jgi:hypothetical protein
MLTLLHLYLGLLVVLSNGVAALWLFLFDRWGRELTNWSLLALYTARTSLALQIGLGIVLIGGGSVGVNTHYLLAILAGVATWVAFTRSRRAPNHPLRILALGCALTSALALGAYLAGQG